MLKKKKLIFVAVLVLVGLWLFRPQTMMDIAKLDMETANIATIIVHDEGKLRRAEIGDKNIIKELFEMLENTDVRFDGWRINTIRYDAAEKLYHLEFYDEKWLPSSELFYFCTNGNIYYGHFLYKMQGEDVEKCTDILEKLLQEYEVAF